jgi:hypothetical protein
VAAGTTHHHVCIGQAPGVVVIVANNVVVVVDVTVTVTNVVGAR